MEFLKYLPGIVLTLFISSSIAVIWVNGVNKMNKQQNKAIARDAALTGLPTLDPNDMPTPAQLRKWASDYAKAQDGALKLVRAVSAPNQ